MNLLVWSIIVSFYSMFSVKFIPKVNYELLLDCHLLYGKHIVLYIVFVSPSYNCIPFIL